MTADDCLSVVFWKERIGHNRVVWVVAHQTYPDGALKLIEMARVHTRAEAVKLRAHLMDFHPSTNKRP